MEKLKLNSSCSTHTSNPFYVDFHHIKGAFNLTQGHTEPMDYFYKHFEYYLATCKFTVCNATSFTGLEKHADDIKDVGQCMAAMCIIKTDDPQRFSHLWNQLGNGTILGYYTGT